MKSSPAPPLGVAVSFDLFGTLVTVDRPADPAAAVATELAARDVAVPADWERAYGEKHIDAPAGAEVPLPAHVAAFDPTVQRREGALAAIEAARDYGPVGLLSNTSVPELARRTLLRADLRDAFDAVVTSVGCGWRKPDARAFEALERRLDAGIAVHAGDDPETDGGVTAVGGTFLDVATVPLAELPDWLAERAATESDGLTGTGGTGAEDS